MLTGPRRPASTLKKGPSRQGSRDGGTGSFQWFLYRALGIGSGWNLLRAGVRYRPRRFRNLARTTLFVAQERWHFEHVLGHVETARRRAALALGARRLARRRRRGGSPPRAPAVTESGRDHRDPHLVLQRVVDHGAEDDVRV